MLNYVKLAKTIYLFLVNMIMVIKIKFILQMITVLYFLILKTKLGIKINA